MPSATPKLSKSIVRSVSVNKIRLNFLSSPTVVQLAPPITIAPEAVQLELVEDCDQWRRAAWTAKDCWAEGTCECAQTWALAFGFETRGECSIDGGYLPWRAASRHSGRTEALSLWRSVGASPLTLGRR